MTATAANQNQIEPQLADKMQLLDALYGRLLRDFDDLKQAIVEGNIHAKAEAIDHARRIVTQFKLALDYQAAPELCRNLMSLYGWVEQCLRDADMHLQIEPVDNASDVIGNLRASFSDATPPRPSAASVLPLEIRQQLEDVQYAQAAGY